MLYLPVLRFLVVFLGLPSNGVGHKALGFQNCVVNLLATLQVSFLCKIDILLKKGIYIHTIRILSIYTILYPLCRATLALALLTEHTCIHSNTST